VVTGYDYVLNPTDGAEVATSSFSASAITWGNVVAHPAGISTTSVTVQGRRGGNTATKSAVATASIQAGATASSTVSVRIS
jgi:hypothetical protein